MRGALAPEQALVGFCGGPFTVAGYLVEGRPTREFVGHEALHVRLARGLARALREARRRPPRPTCARRSRRAPTSCSSSTPGSARCRVTTTRSSSRRTRSGSSSAVDVPTIHFGTGTSHLLETMTETGGDVIGLDWRVRLDEGWERVGHDRGVQGNLDPALLLGPFERVESAAIAILDAAGGRPGHIFNLGHGVLPDTDPADLKRLVELVHERTATSPHEARRRPDGLREPVASLTDIRPYLEDIRSGRPVSDEAVEELTERYRRIGGRSPLDDVTEGTRAALERELGFPVYVGDEALDSRGSPRPSTRHSKTAPTRSSGSCSRRTTRSSRSTGYRERLEDALDGRAGAAVHRELARRTSRTWTCSPTACAAPTRTSSSRRTACRRGSSTMGDPYRDQLLETSQLIAERAGSRVLVVRLPERERDRRAVAGAGHPRGARQPARARRRARARLPDRLRLRPPRDPVGHRRRGARAGRRARARARPHRVAERRPRVRPRVGRAVPRDRCSTLELDEAGEISARKRRAAASASTRTET